MQQVQQIAPSTNAGFAVLLQYPAFNKEFRILCAAAGTCRGWREAVQQCSACNTAVQICLGAPLPHLCSFARWLPKHAALVSSISITLPVTVHEWPNGNGLPWRLHLEAAQQLLQQAMQLATTRPSAAGGQTAAAAADAQQQQAIHLPNISSVTMAGDAAMLSSLPAHSLTHLDLQWLTYATSGPAASTALAQLSRLEQLRMGAWSRQDTVPVSCLASVAQLTRLTALELGWQESDGACTAAFVQLTLQPLSLRMLRLRRYAELPVLDLSHFTQLLGFSDEYESLDAKFPAQLQQLELGWLYSTPQVEALLPLHQLQCLKFVVGLKQPAPLLRLTQLPALQQLVLVYHDARDAARTACTWPQLRQLCELEIDGNDCSAGSRQRWEAILESLAASTNLTKLQLWARDLPAADQQQGLAACGKLAGLISLRDLSLWFGCRRPPSSKRRRTGLMAGDALALTALTGLTRLDLVGAGAGVGDLAACALACTLKQLQHLDLQACALGSGACLAAVAQLTELTELQLECNEGLTQQGLMLLTGLKRLKQLGVSRTAEVTDAVVNNFWVALQEG